VLTVPIVRPSHGYSSRVVELAKLVDLSIMILALPASTYRSIYWAVNRGLIGLAGFALSRDLGSADSIEEPRLVVVTRRLTPLGSPCSPSSKQVQSSRHLD
jgi:hypothetical protein